MLGAGEPVKLTLVELSSSSGRTVVRVTSDALGEWRGPRADRLDELVGAHQRISGTRPGRRWETEQLNWALVLRLAGEFQGFARDLHDLAADAVAEKAGGPLRGLVKSSLVFGRKLDRGNAEPGALGEDFGRFGMDWWPVLQARTPRTKGRQEELVRLNRARNAIALPDRRAR